MSKAVRIREHLYDEIARLAKAERRSLLAQLEVLLEQALKLESSGAATLEASSPNVAPEVSSASTHDTHYRPDPK